MSKYKRSIYATIMAIVLVFCSALCACGNPNSSDTGDKETLHLTDDSGIGVSGTFTSGSQLVVRLVEGADKAAVIAKIADREYDKDSAVLVYDIGVFKGGVKEQPSGKAQVSVPVVGADAQNAYTVFHVKDGGSVETIEPQLTDGKLVFETDSFSPFIIAKKKSDKKQVQVSINILPLARYGMLKVNGTLYENAASYKTTHTEGEEITVEAIATLGHHFVYWGEDKVLSREPVYKFTVGTEDIRFAANFTEHDVQYSEITDETHTEKCKYGDYTETVAHTFVEEEILTEATCEHTGEKKLSCACGKTKAEEIPITDHNYQDGVCTMCGKTQTYVRVNANGVANPNGAYIKMGKTYCEQVRDGNIENALMEIVGSPYLPDCPNWIPFDFGNGDSGENATTYYCDVEYNGLNYRGVYIKESRKDNDNTQTTSSRYWSGTYWFEQRTAMWQIVREQNGKAYLVSKEIWISQRFAESDEGELTYENSWIRNWLINTWINELFTPAQQAILQGNDDCFGDKIFLPSLDEISINNPKPFGLYKYPFCLGAYKEVLQGYGDNYCPYWLRDGIEKGADGKNYVTCVTSRPPFDQTTKYLANKTFVGVVPAVIIEL